MTNLNLKQEIYEKLREWYQGNEDRFDSEDLEEMTKDIIDIIKKYYSSDTTTANDEVLHSKSQSEVSKTKLFFEVFNYLSFGPSWNYVKQERLISELVETGRFSKDDIQYMINKALKNGQIYERRKGYYVKA